MNYKLKVFLKGIGNIIDQIILIILRLFLSFSSKLRLIRVFYRKKTLVLNFIGPKLKNVSVEKITKIEGDIDYLKGVSGEKIQADFNKRSVKIELNDDEIDNISYSYLIRIEHEKGEEYLELIRQSKSFLRKPYSFCKENGYCILGRRSLIPFSFTLKFVFLSLLSYRSRIKKINRSRLALQDTIDVIISLVQNIWKDGINTGPCNKSYEIFSALNVDEQLRKIRGGQFSLQCSGVRDLFFRLAKLEKIKVRKVEAFNYHPPLPELIPYAHSIVEVYNPDNRKWMLVDPWYSVMFSDLQGNYLSCEDLVDVNKNDLDISIIPLIQSTCRKINDQNGLKTIWFQPASDLKLKHYHYVIDDPTMLSIGYLRHFNHLLYGEST